MAAALADAESVLIPAGDKAFAVIFDRLFDFADTFGVKHAGRQKAMKFYRESLGDLPPDLLSEAVDSVVRTYRYGHRLPPPGDLHAAVSESFGARLSAKLRIDSALRFGRFDSNHE